MIFNKYSRVFNVKILTFAVVISRLNSVMLYRFLNIHVELIMEISAVNDSLWLMQVIHVET